MRAYLEVLYTFLEEQAFIYMTSVVFSSENICSLFAFSISYFGYSMLYM